MPMNNSRHLNNVAFLLDVDKASMVRTLSHEHVQRYLGLALAWTFDTWELAIVRNLQHLQHLKIAQPTDPLFNYSERELTYWITMTSGH
jgi:hypothetical protein